MFLTKKVKGHRKVIIFLLIIKIVSHGFHLHDLFMALHYHAK